jgi:hypothetical protein
MKRAHALKSLRRGDRGVFQQLLMVLRTTTGA